MKRALEQFQATHGSAPIGVIAHTYTAVLTPSNLSIPIYRDPDAKPGKIGLVIECTMNEEGKLWPSKVMWFDKAGDL